MRRRLLLTMVGLTVVAVLVVGVPTVVVADPDTQALVLGLGAAVIVAAIAAALVLSRRLTRPLGELAEAADPLGSGHPPPIGPPSWGGVAPPAAPSPRRAVGGGRPAAVR